MSAERATWLLSRAAHYRENGALELAKATAQAAQAEATLELAEQQRIANIIALGEFHIAGDLPPFRSLVMEPINENDVAPTEAIRETLRVYNALSEEESR